MSINENLRNYEAEEEFLNAPYNKSTYYIPGKVITVDENENIRFLPADDISDFIYGQDIEPLYLFEGYLLEQEEKAQIAKLKAINLILVDYSLQAVYLRVEDNEEYIFIISNENPEQYWKVKYSDINNIRSNEVFVNGSDKIEQAILIEFD